MEFYSLNKFLKERFGEKVIKLSIDGGFTCPNRDGFVGDRGCIFCSKEGSGEFAGNRSESVLSQMSSQVNLLSDKWKEAKYIAYFQCFTNTYADVAYLRRVYDEALSFPNTVGIAISTRGDCLSEEVVDLLREYNAKTLLWVEIGLQSIHESTEVFVRRGYDLKVFLHSYERLCSFGIKTVVHVIVGLPSESLEMTKESIYFLRDLGVWGLKIHMLYVAKNTDLASFYEREPFYLLSAGEYIDFLKEVLPKLSKDMVIHRITGDCKKSDLVAPLWILNKRLVLNSIAKA